MLISLHKQATTTPKVRAAIRASDEPAWVLAERHGISEQTVWKWRKRGDVQDRSHTPHRLQTTLTPAQEAVAVALRTMLLLPLDDLLAVVREFVNPNVSRSGLDRCLRRHGVGNLRELKPKAAKPTHKPFKAYEPGYLHIDVKYLPQMADEERRRYLFVAIDRATRWVFIRIYSAKTAANARRFLRDLDRAAPMKITRVLTDNGREFTDRLLGLRRRHATGAHQVDLLCAERGIAVRRDGKVIVATEEAELPRLGELERLGGERDRLQHEGAIGAQPLWDLAAGAVVVAHRGQEDLGVGGVVVVALQQPRVVGVGAENGDLRDRRVEGQHPVIGQQADAVDGRPPGQIPLIVGVVHGDGFVGVDIGLLEQAQGQFLGQYPFAGGVDVALVDQLAKRELIEAAQIDAIWRLSRFHRLNFGYFELFRKATSTAR